jgi:Pyruvate/2-oxoacid:ferredoxin oxidoreductase delta subunit
MLLTLAVKNMFGCIIGFQKARWHMRAGVDSMAFASLLVSIHQAVRPTVSILDGILVLEGEGPGKGGKPRHIGVLMGSCNSFALDTAVCRMLGIDYQNVPVLKIAKEINLINSCEVEGDLPTVYDFKLPQTGGLIFGPRFLHNFLRRHTTLLPVCDNHLCKQCSQCWTICPAQAIRSLEAGVEFNYQKCIRCYCCIEICPHGALHSRETIGGKVMRRLVDKSN